MLCEELFEVLQQELCSLLKEHSMDWGDLSVLFNIEARGFIHQHSVFAGRPIKQLDVQMWYSQVLISSDCFATPVTRRKHLVINQ